MTAEAYWVGCYRIDPAKRELWRDDQLIVLTPQVFDCLTYLLLNRARAVGREELVAAIWGKVDVTETLLGQTVMYARRAVGDTGEAQNVIRTIPRFGYRWIADVAEAADRVQRPTDGQAQVPDTAGMPAVPSHATLARSEQAHGPGDRRADRRWRNLLLAACAGLIPAAFVVAVVWHRPDANAIVDAGAATSGQASSHAMLAVVLPVEVAESADTAWIRFGVMDSLASRLRDGGQPTVPSQTVVALMGMTGASADPLPAIEREIDPGLIVKPRAERSGDGWTVSLALSGRSGLPDTIDGQGASVLAAADAAADRLLARTVSGTGPPLVSSAPGDAALAELLQRAKAALLAGNHEAAGVLLESAPTSLKSHPEVRFLVAQVDYRSGRFEAAQAALESLLPNLPARTQPLLRGRVLLVAGSLARQYGRYTEAERAYRDAIELLDPIEQPVLLGNANAYLALALMGQERFDEAADALARGRVLLEDTGNVLGLAEVEANLGLLHAERGQLSAAVPRLTDAIQRYRRLGVLEEAMAIQIGLAIAYDGLLDHANALVNSREAWLRADKPTTRLRLWAGIVHASALGSAGKLGEARRLLGDLEREAANDTALGASFVWLVSAQLAEQSGDWAKAEHAAAAAHARFGASVERGVAKFRGGAWLIWLRALRAQEKQAEARSRLAAMAAWEQQDGSDHARFYFALAQAEQLWSDDDHAGAGTRYQEALRLAEEIPLPAMIVMVVESYGNALIADGDLQQAAGVIGRAAAWADRDFDSALMQVRLHRALGQRGAWEQALKTARDLAGERAIPAELALPDTSS